jgi:hypothetical protein
MVSLQPDYSGGSARFTSISTGSLLYDSGTLRTDSFGGAKAAAPVRNVTLQKQVDHAQGMIKLNHYDDGACVLCV